MLSRQRQCIGVPPRQHTGESVSQQLPEFQVSKKKTCFPGLFWYQKLGFKKLDLRHPKTLSMEGKLDLEKKLGQFPKKRFEISLKVKNHPQLQQSSGIWLFFAGQHWWTLENIEDLLVSTGYGPFKLNRGDLKDNIEMFSRNSLEGLMRELILWLLFKSRWSRLRHNLEDPRFGFRWGDSAGKTVKPEMVWWIGSPGTRTEAWKRWHFRPKLPMTVTPWSSTHEVAPKNSCDRCEHDSL